MTKAERTLGSVKIIQDHDGTALTSLDGKTVALDAPILIEGRGSSSYTAGAKFMGPQGYNLEFHDGQRNGVGQVMLGMPQNADWALVTCVSDKTCMRNALTYAIARDMAGRGPLGAALPLGRGLHRRRLPRRLHGGGEAEGRQVPGQPPQRADDRPAQRAPRTSSTPTVTAARPTASTSWIPRASSSTSARACRRPSAGIGLRADDAGCRATGAGRSARPTPTRKLTDPQSDLRPAGLRPA